MLKLIPFMLMIFGFTISSFAQYGKYEKAMKTAFTEIPKAKTNEQKKNLANKFVRIGKAEKQEWLPFYYAALEYTKMALNEPTPELIELSEDFRQKAIDRAGKENAELMVIKGMQLTAKLLMDPGKYGPLLSPEIIGTYKAALAISPNHPRAYLMLIQYEENMAKFMGKSNTDFCSKYVQAQDYFGIFEAKPLHPSWGVGMAKSRIKLCENN